MKKEIRVEDFFRDNFTDFSAYASYRAMGSYTDGLKNSQRKVVYTVQRKLKNGQEKVSRLGSIVGLETEYLHGDSSMEQTITNLVRNWDKPLPFLDEEGSFGSRTIPKASAPRYIYTQKNTLFDLIFPQDFYNIETLQNFEGNKIEPKTLTPIVPLLLINGNTGIGSGFAQNILPRDPSITIKTIEKFLISKAKEPMKIIEGAQLPIVFPHFSGKIITEDTKTTFVGLIKQVNTSTLEITELPIGYTIESYLTILEQLLDKKIIVSYTDRSEDNSFSFIIKIKREDLKTKAFSFKEDDNGISPIINTFKLVKTQTENFSCIGPENDFFEFKTANEVFVNYIEFILIKYNELKEYKLAELEKLIADLSEKARFIKLVIEKKIVITNTSKKDIEKQLEKHKFTGYDVYLNMRLYTLTKEKYEELLLEVEKQIKNRDTLLRKTNKDLYLEDLKKLQK